MIGVGYRALALLALLAVALGSACAAPKAGPAAPATRAVRVTARPVYRYVPFGAASAPSQRALGAGRVGVLTDDGLGREVVGADGSVESSAARTADRLMGAVPVPERLGGGFLFWGDVLYRARTFAGPLEAITALPTNAVGLEFGPDFLLVFSPASPPRAFALDPARAVQLSPHGVIDLAATDDGRALALDATGRALASTDGGKSWKDVTLAVGAVHGVRNEGTEVAFVSQQRIGAWLQKDGRLVQRPFAHPDEASPGQRAGELQRRALAIGLALPGEHALVADSQAVVLVDLEAGSSSQKQLPVAEGATCMPVSLADEGLAVCTEYAAKVTTTIVSHVLGAAPQIERTFAGPLELVLGRTLAVVASCSGVATEGAACVRQSATSWVDVSVSAQLLKTWQPVFWVPRDEGGVAVIAREREPRGRKVALVQPTTGSVTPWDTTIDRVSPSGRNSSELGLLPDGSLRGFTTTGTIAVSAKGHVTFGARTFASVSSAGAHALARDEKEHLWQTNDYGATWLEIARPPYDETPEAIDTRVNPRPSGRASRIDCTLSGCAIEHSAGTGSWLRLGWPEDPPLALASASTAAAPAAGPPAAAQPPTLARALPKLCCTARESGPLHATKRALARRPPPTLAKIDFRDLFSGEETYVRYGLRGALSIAASDEDSLARMITQNSSFELWFSEPFDPAGRQRQMTGSLRSWQPPKSTLPALGVSKVPARALDFDRAEGATRPVLSVEPGHGGGLLFLDGGLSHWASSKGQVRPLPAGCSAVSGYVDAKGSLFVACGDRSAATRIVEAPNGVVHLRLHPAAHFRDTRDPGMAFFAPGEPVFPNPDAIAVGRDGKPRILRLPPGDESPTADNPAWLLDADSAPVELAPWSTLEVATSSACSKGDGYRAIVQSGRSWLSVDGSSGFQPQTGMSALVRWSAERVCLEAVEVGFNELPRADSLPIRVSAVARFVGAEPGAAFVGTESAEAVREPARCVLEAAAPAKP